VCTIEDLLCTMVSIVFRAATEAPGRISGSEQRIVLTTSFAVKLIAYLPRASAGSVADTAADDTAGGTVVTLNRMPARSPQRHGVRRSNKRSMPDWAHHYFEYGYAQRWGVLPVTDRVRHETACLWGRLQLAPRARVVDLGCGQGRYALAFAEHGANVIGVDSAASLLRQAKRLGADGGVSARWVRGDIRHVALRRGSCDAVVVMDAFGFFEAEDENERVLAEAARVLVAGGCLALKVVNGEPILASFRHADREERDGVVVTLSRSLTLEPPRMIERVSLSGSRGNGQYERRQRLYRADELSAAAKRVGFTIVGLFADACGGVFEPATSPTMWVIAQRPRG
jgi:ubiquinone/menaquinone biosynthesis C-methylase UbiE